MIINRFPLLALIVDYFNYLVFYSVPMIILPPGTNDNSGRNLETVRIQKLLHFFFTVLLNEFVVFLSYRIGTKKLNFQL
jgi:hypothetical protein